jgi:hypothetical protein
MINLNLIRVAVLLFALLLVAGCGDGGSSDATAESRPKSEPPLYHQKEYDVETGWTQGVSDRKVGSYLESIWHDPASYSSELTIDSRPAEGAPPPLIAAELARIQVNSLPKYRERTLKRVKLGKKRSAIRWVYYAAGEDRIAYFFEECGTSIIFRGSTTPIAFEPFSDFYGFIASHLKAVCDEEE